MLIRTLAIGLGVTMHLGGSLDAYALDGHRRITHYAQTHFAARENLPQSFVIAIAQTSDGYLWSSSQEGLSRFAGDAFTIFNHRNTKGISANTFTALAVDREGTLWAGAGNRGAATTAVSYPARRARLRSRPPGRAQSAIYFWHATGA